MMENILTQTIDNGVIEEIQIAPIGKFYGSKIDGSAIEENITEDRLSTLADELNKGDEILLDVDHNSVKVGPTKDSRAAGWLSNFIVKPLKGLFAKLSLTKYGKDLLTNREYRYTSPVFSLNENGEPEKLCSVALTNTPAFKNHINPILNQEANEILIEKDILQMNKEELREMIISIISELEEARKTAEIKEEIKEEIIENEEATTEEKTEVVEETTVEESAKEEVAEETTEEKTVEEEKKEDEEVIKIEALNSAPILNLTSEPAWKNLKGKEFFDWLKTHPKGK